MSLDLNGETVSEIVISRRDGYLVNILDFDSVDMPIEEIAWNLAHIHRYGGAQPSPVSVALHSLVVSYLVPESHAYEGLMHDATEAFVGDVMNPIKRLCKDFQAIEAAVRKEIVLVYRLPSVESARVIKVDKRTRELECGYRRNEPIKDLTPHERRVCDFLLLETYSPQQVVEMFLARYESSNTLSLQWQ